MLGIINSNVIIIISEVATTFAEATSLEASYTQCLRNLTNFTEVLRNQNALKTQNYAVEARAATATTGFFVLLGYIFISPWCRKRKLSTSVDELNNELVQRKQEISKKLSDLD